jgi:hypothetical protein
MTHCSDDDLVLHYYGEDDRPAAHLRECGECARRYETLATLLRSVRLDVPERGERYGLEVWQAIRPRLAPRRRWFSIAGSLRPAFAAAAVVLLVAGAFAIGRMWPRPAAESSGIAAPTIGLEEERRRVLLLSVADHLDRSDRVLTDIMNAPDGVEISAEQQWATDLVSANRLFRQDALDVDESAVAAVLDDLERALLDITHEPAGVAPADLGQLRRRIDSAALLFKVRVMSTDLRDSQRLRDRSRSYPSSAIGGSL